MKDFETISSWFDKGRESGERYMLVMYDSEFDVFAPKYVTNEHEFDDVYEDTLNDCDIVFYVFDMNQNKGKQFLESKPWNVPTNSKYKNV